MHSDSELESQDEPCAEHHYRMARIDALFEDAERLKARGEDPEYVRSYFDGRHSILFPEYEVWKNAPPSERPALLPASPPVPRIIRFHRWFRTSFARRPNP